jgi:hypothetical protein
MENRDCNTCIWHTENGCASWDCDYISRDEAVKAVKAMRGEEEPK